uniref:Transferrin-1 n=1 Tax=Schmidtea mediterranea TaxID=79327 RepID=I1ZIJ4_SCHMD|nr:transferrin-1 [Schmidtea mediterranea]
MSIIDESFKRALDTINQCSIPGVSWCAPDQDVMEKCGRMKTALQSIRVEPSFNCIYGESIPNCMNLVSEGYADLMTLDAAELFIGGKYMDLVPIAIEFYGDSTDYYGVAVVKEMDKGILISNWYNVKTCHGGIGRAVGWVLPVTIALNTQQLVIHDRNLISSFAQLVSRACIPGILDQEFNPDQRHPINLCEICSGGGADLCMASSVEAQFTESGAFVCLLEIGDLAFVKHFTVYDNTEGRNKVDWARNKKLDDFELLCPDGTRQPITKWKNCNIGKVPGTTVVTGSFKSVQQRETMWLLLRLAQDHFSTDGNSFFSMFESPFNRYDLMFSDAAVSLKPIPFINQTYQDILGEHFIRQCEALENLSKPGYSGFYTKPKS